MFYLPGAYKLWNNLQDDLKNGSFVDIFKFMCKRIFNNFHWNSILLYMYYDFMYFNWGQGRIHITVVSLPSILVNKQEAQGHWRSAWTEDPVHKNVLKSCK